MFHEDILNCFQVTERTRFCDKQMDRQTTMAKTIYLPTLKWGDIKASKHQNLSLQLDHTLNLQHIYAHNLRLSDYQVQMAGRGSSIRCTSALCVPTVSETFFRSDLVVKKILRPISPFRWFKEGSCQLLVKEWALSTGKLPRRLAQEQCD